MSIINTCDLSSHEPNNAQRACFYFPNLARAVNKLVSVRVHGGIGSRIVIEEVELDPVLDPVRNQETSSRIGIVCGLGLGPILGIV